MVVLVCGSRTWCDYWTVKTALQQVCATRVIHGACRGADAIAHGAAADLGLPVDVFHAEWVHGKVAGVRRNRVMLDAGPDRVLAFCYGLEKTRGTKDLVTEACRRGIPTLVITGPSEALALEPLGDAQGGLR